MKQPSEIDGVLSFHSETGTEGGDWAFQDEKFISKVLANYGLWDNQTVWDSTDPKRKGRNRKDAEVFCNGAWYPLPDPMTKDHDYYASSLFCGEVRGDHEADKRLMEKYDFKIKYSVDRMNESYGKGNWQLENPLTAVTSYGTRVSYGGTPITEPSRPYGVSYGALTRVTVDWEDGTVEQRLSHSLLVTSYSYEGLHILKNMDYLFIFDKQDPEKIIWEGMIRLHHHELFTETTSAGMWIHADQEGVERSVWEKFFLEGYPAKLIPAHW